MNRHCQVSKKNTQLLTGSFPRNSSGSDEMTLSIAIFIAKRGKHKQLNRGGKGGGRNTRTLLSFLSFGVNLGLPFFLVFPAADLEDSGARDPSANVVVSTRAVFVVSSALAVASPSTFFCPWAATAAAAARASSSVQRFHFSNEQPRDEINHRKTHLPSASQGRTMRP